MKPEAIIEKVAKSKPVFLSHASKDKPLANALVDLLTSGCGVNPNDILCTSLEGKGIPLGTASFVDFLKEQIQKPQLVVLLLSDNFFASQFCVCELGAVWGMGLRSFPLVVPPLERSKLTGVLAVVQMGELNSPASLDELRDELDKLLGARVATSTWTVKRDGFLDALAKSLDCKGYLEQDLPKESARIPLAVTPRPKPLTSDVQYTCPGCGLPANAAGSKGPGKNEFENEGRLCRTCNAFVHSICCKPGSNDAKGYERVCPVCGEVVEYKKV